MTLRVCVDATCWANPRGYGRFTRELVPQMASQAPDVEFTCLLDRRAAAVFDLRAPNVRSVIVEQQRSPTEAASADSSRSIPDMLRLSRAVSRLDTDVFFSPSVYTYFPLPPRQRAVVTIHDAIAERFPALTLPSRRARVFWRAKVALAIRQADLILTVSDHAARQLADVLRIPSRRIRVTLEAPAEPYRAAPDPARIAAARQAVGLPADAHWLAYVGGFNPHKLVDVLVRAHARLAATRGSPPHLLLVGAIGTDVFHGAERTIREAITTAGTTSLVHWTGFVPDEELRHLLAGADALVLASAAEGFGLPAVEAACCGTPVIATTESPLPELLEGGGLFVQPGDEDGLHDAMERLTGDPALRAAMGARARERAMALTWDAAAARALAVLREAAR